MSIYYVVLNSRGKAVLIQEHALGREELNLSTFVNGKDIQWIIGQVNELAYSLLLPSTGEPLPKGWITFFVEEEWPISACLKAQKYWWEVDAFILARSVKVSGQYRMIDSQRVEEEQAFNKRPARLVRRARFG